MKPQEFTELRPKIVLAVGAHPDDIDFGAGGTMAAFASMGAKLHYLQITDGGKGSADPDITSAQLIKIRQQEQKAACAAIGGKEVHFLNYPDGCLEVTLGLKAEIVKAIHSVRPDVVITLDPGMAYSLEQSFINHPDHRAVGQATLDAVFPLARDHLSFPELYAAGYLPHKVKTVLLTTFDRTVLLTNFDRQNYYVDITNSLDKKFAALRAHSSQIPDFDSMRVMFTEFAATVGKHAGYSYAEGFVRLDVMA